MTEAKNFLHELSAAIARGSPESRARALSHATELLITGTYTEDQIWVFGEVIGRLAEVIEVAARAKLAKRLAQSDNAPVNVIMFLALDDSIDVAGPVLQHSPRLDNNTLVAAARTKSQAHLLAISKRHSVPVPVTNELVMRGNCDVARSIASNGGARFSEGAFLQLVKRSEGDSILAENLGLRKEIPRHLFQQLIAKASDDVRSKLLRERPDLADQIKDSVAAATGTLHSKFGPATKSYFCARKQVAALYQRGGLTESSILEFARAHNLEAATVGLSMLCSLPVDVVERALVHNRGMVLILATAMGFTWETAMALLFLGAKDHRISTHELEAWKDEFARLDRETSCGVLELYQSRKIAAGLESGQRRLPQLHSAG